MKVKMNYYNEITGKYEQLYVKEQFARFIASSDKKMKRDQRLYDKYTVPMDTVISDNGKSRLTIEDTLTDGSEFDENEKIEKEKIKSALWRVVDTLDEKQKKIIIDYFVNDKKQSDIANELGITASAVNQLKDTAINQLRYKLGTDKDFMETYYYKSHRQKFDKLVLDVAMELNKPESLTIDMKGVEKITKLGTQFLKQYTKLNLDLDEEMLGLFKFMNDTVREVVSDFKNETNGASKLVITSDYELKAIE